MYYICTYYYTILLTDLRMFSVTS